MLNSALGQFELYYDPAGRLYLQSNSAATMPSVTQAASRSVSAESNGVLSISAPIQSGGLFDYQWLLNGIAIAGATNETFFLTNASSSNLGKYQLIASNSWGIVTSAVINVSFDSDHNGLPDAWEIGYFGHIGIDPDADSDRDGVSNFEEFVDGTDPTDPKSLMPRLRLNPSANGAATVTPLKFKYQLGDTVQLTAIPDPGESLISWLGSITNTNTVVSLVMDGCKTIQPLFGLPLSQVLDTTNLIWRTGGGTGWFGQTNISYDGISAAQSSTVPGQTTWLETTVVNTVTNVLTFNWNVSDRLYNTPLSFSMNGALLVSIGGREFNVSGGQSGWKLQSFIIPPGTNILHWEYTRNVADDDFFSSGWLDRVEISPIPPGYTVGSSNVVAWGTPYFGLTQVPVGLVDAIAVSAGADFSVALRKDGSVVAWGDNGPGETSISSGIDISAIAEGDEHTLALKKDGTVVAWGNDANGQIDIPIGLSNVTAIAAGSSHSLALKNDGTVFAWGNNSARQTDVPAGLGIVVAIAAGANHSLALNSDGTVSAWGLDPSGATNVPAGLDNVVAIGAGSGHSLALKNDGTVVAWGTVRDINSNVLLDTNVPAGLSNVVAISAGRLFNLALKSDGEIVAWGDNSSGQTNVPPGLSNIVVSISAGAFHSLAVIGDGSPFIRRESSSQTVGTGAATAFQVFAGGTAPLNYQWQLNGTNLFGATSASLTLTNVQLSDAGIYTLTVSNSHGSIMSSNVTLSVVISPPVIAIQPKSQTLFPGQTASLFVEMAACSAPLSYQWQFDGQDLSSATDSSIVITNFSAVDAGTYSVVVSNAYGAVISSNVSLAAAQVTSWGDGTVSGTNLPPLADVIAVAVSGDRFGSHALALKVDGSVVAWGDDVIGPDHGETAVPVGLDNIRAIAAGAHHNLVVRNDGTVFAWGDDSEGQADVPLGLSNVVAVAAGSLHSVALRADGTVVAWGYNGDGETNVPPGLVNVVSIAAGSWHTLALKGDGTVVAWGYNAYGQTTVPVGLSNAVAVAAGEGHSLAVKSDGSVGAWGANYNGQINVPPGLSNVVSIAAGEGHSLALKRDGTVTGWGDDYYGEISGVSGISNVIAIAAGDYQSLAINNDGTLFIGRDLSDRTTYSGIRTILDVGASGAPDLTFQWQHDGTNLVNETNCVLILNSPQLSDSGVYNVIVTGPAGVITSSNAILQVLNTAPSIIVQPTAQTAPLGQDIGFSVVAAGPPPLAFQWQFNGTDMPGATNASLLLTVVTQTNIGSYHVVVTNIYGRVISSDASFTRAFSSVIAWGYNDDGETNVPNGLANVVSLAAGAYHTVALKTDGTVAAWGYDGDGETDVPTGLSNVVAIAAGESHSLALKNDGTVVGWGADYDGEIDVPAGLTNVIGVAVGYDHNLALKMDGTVAAWGDNYDGATNVPVGLSNVVAVAVGDADSFAVKNDGSVIAWGYNHYGETNVPAGLSNVVAITPGDSHVVALKSDGTVVAWGYNFDGETNVPADLTNVVAIAVSTFGYHSLALRSDGTVSAWGYNGDGETNVPTGLSNVVAVAAGEDTSFALKADGSIVEWGYDGNGETDIPAAARHVIGAALGGSHTAAIVSDGSLCLVRSPLSQNLTLGATATLNVGVVGGALPLSFQWQLQGTNLPGLTTSSITLQNFQLQNAGIYSVVVSDAQSVTINAQATLNLVTPPGPPVISPPVVTVQPASQSVLAGQNITFSVSVSGASPFAYQWDFNGVDIVKATGTTLILTNVQPVNSGFYSVTVTNVGGSVTSSNAILTVTAFPPSITNQPQNQGVFAGQTAVFAVGVTGAPPIAYQWLFNGTNIADGTGSVLNVVNSSGENVGNYFVVVTNAYGSLTSSIASLRLLSHPVVVCWGDNSLGETNVPVGLTDVRGIYATQDGSSVAIKTNGTITVWGHGNLPSLTNVIAIAGNSDYGIVLRSDRSVTEWGGEGLIEHSVSPENTTFGAEYLPSALRDIDAIAPGVTLSRGVVTDWDYVFLVETAIRRTLTRALEGYDLLVPLPIGSPPTGTNIVAITQGSGYLGSYFALHSDGSVEEWDDASYYSYQFPHVYPPPLTNAVAIAACPAVLGSAAAVTDGGTVIAWGDGSVSGFPGYGYGQSDVPAGLSNVVTLAAGFGHYLALRSDGTVAAWGDNTYGQTIVPPGLSNVVAVAAGFGHSMALVNDGSPSIVRSPFSMTVYSGAGATLSAGAVGVPPLSYQWQLNGTNLFGATGSSLEITSVGSDAVGLYRVSVSNSLGTAVSSNALLSIIPIPPIITNQPADKAVLLGETTSFSVGINSYFGFNVNWRLNGTNIPGANSAVLSRPNVSAADLGVYQAVVTYAYGTATSAPALLRLRPSNDDFTNRQIITGLTNTVTGSNSYANKEPGEPNHADNTGGHSVWWTWTAPASGIVTIDTFGSSFDTTLGVYTGNTVNGLTSVAGNEDYWPLLTSLVNLEATGGNAYQIAVDGYNGASGNIVLSLREVVAPPPAPIWQPLSRVDGGLLLPWTAISGRTYQVQYKTNLNQPDWRNLITTTATNSDTAVIDSMGPDPQRFYRVVLLP